MQGLIKRGIHPTQIIHMEPKREDQRSWLDPESDESAIFSEPFEEDKLVKAKISSKLEKLGIKHIKNVTIIGFEEDTKLLGCLGGVK